MEIPILSRKSRMVTDKSFFSKYRSFIRLRGFPCIRIQGLPWSRIIRVYYFKKFLYVFLLFLGAGFLIAWTNIFSVEEKPPMQLTSPAFKHGKEIPIKNTCDDIDVSPPLSWINAPTETKSFALICDDPDAPVKPWIHWVIYNIPAKMNQLNEGVQRTQRLASGARQGMNDSVQIGYWGPCPHYGHGHHRYFFKLYALDTKLSLFNQAVTKAMLLKAMNGHILAKAELMGRYKRKMRVRGNE